MKRNEKFLEAKQSENTVYLFRFGWKRKIRSEKRERAKRISFRFVSLWNEQIFEAKPAHPSCDSPTQKFRPRNTLPLKRAVPARESTPQRAVHE
jgi:hypothetical protein